VQLIASGRDCDVYDAGPGLVLRRQRDGRSIEHEARIMDHLREAGYPVPRVDRAEGADLVMERIDGPTLLDHAIRRPLRLARWAAVLAELHQRLHRIEAPEWLPEAGDGGTTIVHFDLHPLNVLMSPRGPVVIDWTNAMRGDEATDVAQTWIIMATSTIEGSWLERTLGPRFRGLYVRSFLGHFDLAPVRARLAQVGEARKADPNLRPEEVLAVDRLVAAEGR
jgi:aminoglycoside phosphotransferase (APT) family kinase protein